jgi:hypothetical protein
VAFAHAEALLAWQSRLQRPLGSILVAMGLLAAAEVPAWLVRQARLSEAMLARAA